MGYLQRFLLSQPIRHTHKALTTSQAAQRCGFWLGGSVIFVQKVVVVMLISGAPSYFWCLVHRAVPRLLPSSGTVSSEVPSVQQEVESKV